MVDRASLLHGLAVITMDCAGTSGRRTSGSASSVRSCLFLPIHRAFLSLPSFRDIHPAGLWNQFSMRDIAASFFGFAAALTCPWVGDGACSNAPPSPAQGRLPVPGVVAEGQARAGRGRRRTARAGGFRAGLVIVLCNHDEPPARSTLPCAHDPAWPMVA